MKILADAALPNLSQLFKAPFILTRYTSEKDVPNLLLTHDILMCRSTLKVTKTLLTNSPIQCVATASSGVDHIDSHYLEQHQITLFDAKGCNAEAVADYVMATLAYLYRNDLIIGKKAGIIGLGAVGRHVMMRLNAMGFNVICFDPLRQLWDTETPYCTLSSVTQCDVICIHANFHNTKPYPSANLLDVDFLNQLKPGTVIINTARGGIVNEAALLSTVTPITYCTDVYEREPNINPAIVTWATLCTPHIAGHSIEAKNAAVAYISQQLHQHYGLPLPALVSDFLKPFHRLPQNDRLEFSTLTETHWIDDILSLYNPLSDTLILKSTSNKKITFLTQRQAHKNRHNFSFYHQPK